MIVFQVVAMAVQIGGDLLNVGALGIIGALLIFFLYSRSPQAAELYPTIWMLWVALIPIAIWLIRMLALGYLGRQDYDPIVFAMRDKMGIGLLLITLSLMFYCRWPLGAVVRGITASSGRWPRALFVHGIRAKPPCTRQPVPGGLAMGEGCAFIVLDGNSEPSRCPELSSDRHPLGLTSTRLAFLGKLPLWPDQLFTASPHCALFRSSAS